MVATAALIIAFISIALVVFFVAMSGGPRAARKKAASHNPVANRINALVLTVIIVGIGIAIPGVVMAINAEERSAEAPGGVELTAAQEEGREIFAVQCAQCHQLEASNAVGRVGPNLDELRPPAELTLDAILKGRARGQGQMPAELVTGERAEHVASYVEAVAGRGG